MAKKKGPAGRRAYLNDFQPDVNGSYVYTGEVYTWASPEERRRVLARLWALALAMTAAAAGCGCITAAGMGNCAWVLLPYIAGLIALAMLLWALWRLSAAGMEIRAYVYEEAALTLKGRAVFLCISTLILLGAMLLYLLLHGFENRTFASLAVVFLQVIFSISSFFFYKTISRLHWKKME